MDQGAHFHKCDFQVHTPRDSNWDGAGAVADDERRTYAKELVAACRQKGLEAIAITDHHDVAFFKYIREAAVNETDGNGKLLDPAARLTVFPGIELTLSIPCQALLIFDAELPPEFLSLALIALGVTPSDPSAATAAPVKKLVHAPIQAELDAIEEEVSSLVGYLRAQFERVVRQRVLQKDIGAHDIELASLKEQLEHLRSSLKGLSAEDTKVIARQARYELEQRVLQSLERDAAAARTALETLGEELKRIPAPLNAANTPENAETIRRAHGTLQEWAEETRQLVATLLDAFAEPFAGKRLAGYFDGVSAWKQRRANHRAEYEHAKERAAAHEETLRQIHSLEERLAQINEAADSKKQSLARLGDPVAEFAESRAQLKRLYGRRAELLEAQCKALTANPQSRLKATLRRAADTEPLAANMREFLKGTRTRGERVDSLVQQITIAADPLMAGDPVEVWHGILDELYELAWIRVEDEATTHLPASPTLDAAEFSRRDKLAMARQLEPGGWLDLMLFDLKDLPVFEYEIREDDFIPFENASPGQQATALLSILLLQDGPPLLIDQPEDDLNMKIINDIVETLWQAKRHRQVIFVSHNANLVVNGDAELVVCCDYRTTATESGGQIKLAGAIDVPEINAEIAEVMEGGVEAFKLRYQKYGF
jgi:chromosome segregation protein